MEEVYQKREGGKIEKKGKEKNKMKRKVEINKKRVEETEGRR